MSAAGAIEAGQSFIRFFADMTDLYGSFKTAGAEINSVARNIAENVSKQISGGLDNAATSANSFGQTAAAASGTASTGLQQVAADATVATAAVGQVGKSFSLTGAASKAIAAAGGGIKGMASSAWGAVGGLGGIAKTAWAASRGLRAASIAGRLFGKDTSALEPWIKNLNRISWGAWGVNTALKAVSLTASGLRGLASLPGRALGAAGRFAGRFGRIGGVASVGATVADSVGGEAQGEGGSGKAVAGGALTGLMMGGVVGAGLGAAAVGLGLTIKTALSRGAMEGARESKDFITQLGVAMIDAGNWIKGVWTQVYDKFKSVFASMATEGPSVFQRIKDALFPIVDAVTNVWLPAMFSAMDSVANYFRSGTQQMGRTWTGWIVETIAGVADVVANFDLYFQYAQQTIVMWAGNAILRVGDFFNNVGSWLSWFADNWVAVFTDAASYVGTVFGNLGADFGEMFSRIWDHIESGFTSDLNFDGLFTKLEDGFQSTISEWPKMIATELETETPEMAAISKQILERQKAMESRRGKGTGNIEAGAAAVEAEAKKASDTRFGAVSAQSQEAYSAIARTQNLANDKKVEIDLAKQQLNELKEIKKAAQKPQPAGGWSISP